MNKQYEERFEKLLIMAAESRLNMDYKITGIGVGRLTPLPPKGNDEFSSLNHRFFYIVVLLLDNRKGVRVYAQSKTDFINPLTGAEYSGNHNVVNVPVTLPLDQIVKKINETYHHNYVASTIWQYKHDQQRLREIKKIRERLMELGFGICRGDGFQMDKPHGRAVISVDLMESKISIDYPHKNLDPIGLIEMIEKVSK